MPENTERILLHLQNFQGIEALRQLFWVELNYKRNNTPIENLPDGSADLIIESPISFATAGKNSDFHVIYTELKSDKLRKTDERQVITHLQTRFPDALYVFSNSGQEQWHFINVKLTRDKQEESEEQPQARTKLRNIFRRITIAPEERLRTAAERITMLDVEEIGESDGLFDSQDILSSLDIRTAHEEAFNVESVTEAFFEDFKRVFKQLQNEFVKEANETSAVFYNPNSYLVDCRLYYSDLPDDVFLFLNSAIGAMFFELYNRTGLGGGARSMMVSDYEDVPTLVKANVDKRTVEFILKQISPLSPRKFANSESEWSNLDAIIFDALNLTQSERDGVYEAVTKLVTTRLQKAKT